MEDHSSTRKNTSYLGEVNLRLQAKMREAEEVRLRSENVEANRENGTVSNDTAGEIGGSVPVPACMGQTVISYS